MSNSYVASHAILRCSCGSDLTILTVSNSRSVKLCGKPMANIGDNSVLNIHYYGICCAAGSSKACMPITPNKWEGGKHDCLVQGEPALLKTSVLRCMCGGIITLQDDGQSLLSIQDRLFLFKRMKETEELDVRIKWYDNPRLDWIGYVPLIGSIFDLVRAYKKGDVRGFCFALVFLALDLGGGWGTVCKCLTKYAIKQVAKNLTKKTGEKVAEVALKQGIREAPKRALKKARQEFKKAKKRENKATIEFEKEKRNLANEVMEGLYLPRIFKKGEWDAFKNYIKLPVSKKIKKEIKVVRKRALEVVSKLSQYAYHLYEDLEKSVIEENEREKEKHLEYVNKAIIERADVRNIKKVKTGTNGITRVPLKDCL